MKDAAALLIGLTKGKGSPSSLDDDDSKPDMGADDEEGGDSYGSELASILNVSDDDKADFLTALRGYVRGCK